jgi:hypothetical protein
MTVLPVMLGRQKRVTTQLRSKPHDLEPHVVHPVSRERLALSRAHPDGSTRVSNQWLEANSFLPSDSGVIFAVGRIRGAHTIRRSLETCPRVLSPSTPERDVTGADSRCQCAKLPRHEFGGGAFSHSHPQPFSQGREKGANSQKKLPSLVTTREGRRAAAG